MAKKKITGIIMAGGQSSRMGTDKPNLVLGDKSLLEHSISNLKEFCDQVLISSNSQLQTEFTIVFDEIKNIGPVSGIISCLNKSENETNFVLSCDLPFISLRVIKTILGEHSSLITVPTIDGKNLEPLCAVYSKNALPFLEEAAKKGNYKLHKILKELDADIIDMSVYKEQFLNINYPEDYIKALEKYNSKN